MDIPYNLNVFPPSPNSASLAKFGDIPVGQYTGTPSVSIPLYTIQTGELTLPIGTSYHAGGYRVGEMASNIGLGWALQGSGSISRTVRGLADESATGYLNNIIDINSVLSYTEEDKLELFRQVTNNDIDLQADIFTFNFFGRSGKFVIDKSTNKGILFNNNELLWIEFVNQNKFVVTDNNGSKYYFGEFNGDFSIERSRITQNGRPNIAAMEFPTSWFLVRAEDCLGNYLDFEYDSYTTSYCSINHETNYVTKAGSYTGTCIANNEYTVDSYTIYGKKIRKIKWKAGEVEFLYSNISRTDLTTTDNYLQKVEIRDKEIPSTLITAWEFSYSYFNLNNGQSDPCSASLSGPLRLTSIQQVNNDPGSLPPYEFTYNNNVPGRSSRAVDHWGFYNGKNTNNSLIPELAVNNNGAVILLPGADRQPNTNASQAGILTSIKYPTGGKTDFEYEGHVSYTTSFPNEVEVEVPYVLYATVNKSDLVTLPIKRVPFSVDPITTLDNVSGAWLNIAVFIDQACDPSVREGGCEGEIYIRPVDGVSGTSWTFSGTGVVSGTVNRRIFVEAGSYELVLRSFGDPQDVKYLYANVFGPDTELIDEDQKFDRLIGGLRIKSIINRDGSGVATKKIFKYHQSGNPSRSSGVLVDVPNYLSEFRRNAGFQNGAPLICIWYARHSNSRIPLGITQGSHIGYAHVVVEEINSSNLANGREIFEYTTATEWPDIGTLSFPYPPRTSFDPRRGLLLRHTIQRKGVGNEYKNVKVMESEYGPSGNQSSNYHPGLFYGCYQLDVNGNCETVALQRYLDLSIWIWKSKETISDFVDDNTVLTTEKIFRYDNVHHKLLTSVEQYSSEGIKKTIVYKYPLDFADLDLDDPELEMKNIRNMNARPIQVTSSINRNATDYIISDVVYKYEGVENSKIALSKVFKLNIAAPLPISSFIAYKPSDGVNAGSYSNEVQLAYDLNNNINRVEEKSSVKSVIWDYQGNYPVASIINAELNEVAYTSFEADGTGGWSVPDNSRYDLGAVTGTKAYELTGTNNLTKTGLPASSRYVVTYWSMSGSALVNGSAGVSGISSNGWTFWRHELATVITSVTVSGTGKIIDELRLFPSDAQLQTFCYQPLLGKQCEADVNSIVVYYEYESFGRLSRVLDMDRKILKQYCYNYAGQVNNCTSDPLWNRTDSTRCKPCPDNGSYITNIQQAEEKDLNPNSSTYNTTRWVDLDVSSSCSVTADWQFTATAIRCKQNGSNENTGEQEREERDLNPCSATYNQVRWTVVGTNTSACPLPGPVSIVTNNSVSGTTFYLHYYNQSTTQSYHFTSTFGSNVTVGTVPPGTYTVEIGSTNFLTSYVYSLACGFFASAPNYTFYNVAVSNSCRVLSITPY